MEMDRDKVFGVDDLEKRLYDELRSTYQAFKEGEDLTDREEFGLLLFYLGEIDKSVWVKYVDNTNPPYVISNVLSAWKKENKDLLDEFKKKNKANNGKALRSGWL